MKLKIKSRDEPKIECMMSGASWTMNNEIYYAVDDKAIFKVN